MNDVGADRIELYTESYAATYGSEIVFEQYAVAAGFTVAQALEGIVGGAVSLLANYTNHLAHAPLDEFLQPQAWRASA